MPSSVENLKGFERLNLIEVIKRYFEQIFHQKKLKQLEAEGKKYHEKRIHEETKEKQQNEQEEAAVRDAMRQYVGRKAHVEKRNIDDARRELVVEEAISDLQDKVTDPSKEPIGSAYLFDTLKTGDVSVLEGLERAMRTDPAVAIIIKNLASKGKELHGDAAELIKEGQRLNYYAGKAGVADEVSPFIDAITERAQNLVKNEIPVRQQMARRYRLKEPDGADWLAEDKGIILTTVEQNILKDNTRWQEAIESVIKNPRASVAGQADWADLPERADLLVSGKLIGQIDKIWNEVKRREDSPNQLSVEELETTYRQIQEAESAAYPRDVLSGSTASLAEVKNIRDNAEGRLNELARQLNDRRKEEIPSIARGTVKNTKEFLDAMSRRRGGLGQLLLDNPEMETLLVGTSEESLRFRNLVFLNIHSAVLRQRREGAHDNFGLYERADFSTYVDLVAHRMAGVIRGETGQTFGQTWVDWYTGLSNTIRLSRDIDYWASQPGATWENFQRSLSLYQNEYSSQALSMPAVEQALRALETTLRSVRSSNDGYIPPGLIDYSGGQMFSYWDNQSENMFRKFMKLGQVHDVSRDRNQFIQVEEDGHTVKLGKKLEIEQLDAEDPQRLETLMYMTLAKGFGMTSGRFLEYFATARIPGSEHPETGMPGFSSIPYEGVAMALDYFNTMLYKWKFGGHNYFYFVNSLIPSEKKIPINRLGEVDARQAYKAYTLYREDPEAFRREFGDKAKRFIDATNMSSCSSALGPHTTFRQVDSTLGWTDRKREYLGGATQIMLARIIAESKIKDYLVVNKYREEFRDNLGRKGFPTVGAEFEKLWQEEGLQKYGLKIDKEWRKLQGRVDDEAKHHDPLKHEWNHLVESYMKAYKARIWVEMAMRNPIVAAHNLKVSVPLVTLEGEKKISLHSLIVQDVLGIPLQDTKYGTISASQIAYGATPTETQKRYITDVLDLEGDLAAVREIAIEQNRDLTDADFNIIKDPVRKQHSIKYWKTVREVVLGSSSDGMSEQLYKELGMAYGPDEVNYATDWKKIHKIDSILESTGNKYLIKDMSGRDITFNNILKQAAEQEMPWMYGTDDVSFRRMDTLNLGSRHWVRRGGDIGGHFMGAQKAVDYMVHITPNPDIQDLMKKLLEIRDAYGIDAIEWGYVMAGNLAKVTSDLYAFDYTRLGSAAQLDIWKSKRGVAAWHANKRREFWDAVEHMNIIPAVGSYPFFHDVEPQNIHNLRAQARAADKDVWTEIILLGMLVALGMTIWRAFTAKSEDEEDGGGHH